MLDYYSILGVPTFASKDEIKQAYREQIKFFHPDAFQVSPEIAYQKTRLLNEAYSVLNDDGKRKVYDQLLFSQIQRENGKKKADEGEGTARETKQEKRKVQIKFPSWLWKYLFALSILLVLILSIQCHNLWVKGTNIEKENESLEYENGILQSRISTKEQTIQDLSSNYANVQQDLEFWEDHAVFVTESGVKYHRKNCQYVNWERFWIYNVENAIYKGYSPCSVCDPPTR